MKEPQDSLASFKVKSTELRSFSRKPLIATLTGIVFIFVSLGLASIYYEEQIVALTQQIANTFGIMGLCGIVLFADSLLVPLPPDVALLVISKSGMQHDWVFYVACVALASTLAGQLAYVLGRLLFNSKYIPVSWQAWPQKYSEHIKKYGAYTVILGAIAPLPFSLCCISAGFLRMPFPSFLLASLIRFPYIYLCYFIISSADVIKNLFR